MGDPKVDEGKPEHRVFVLRTWGMRSSQYRVARVDPKLVRSLQDANPVKALELMKTGWNDAPAFYSWEKAELYAASHFGDNEPVFLSLPNYIFPRRRAGRKNA